MTLDTQAAVAILQKFRDDARQALGDLRDVNADPAFVEEVRRTYADAERRLERLVLKTAPLGAVDTKSHFGGGK